MRIYYDEEGDYLDIFVGEPRPNYGEDTDDDVTVFKDEETDEIVGIGILNFKKRSKNLDEIKLNLPLKINFSALKQIPSKAIA